MSIAVNAILLKRYSVILHLYTLLMSLALLIDGVIGLLSCGLLLSHFNSGITDEFLKEVRKVYNDVLKKG